MTDNKTNELNQAYTNYWIRQGKRPLWAERQINPRPFPQAYIEVQEELRERFRQLRQEQEAKDKAETVQKALIEKEIADATKKAVDDALADFFKTIKQR